MNKWIKKGFIYAPDHRMHWAKHSALTPTPFLLNGDVIRVYAGFRDNNGVSRIGFVDLDADNPSRIIGVSETPVVDVGNAGCFDDGGVILGDVVRCEDKVYMYYVGFQQTQKVPFLAFTGLAVSRDGGTTFSKHAVTPILDRAEEGQFFRAAHSVVVEDGLFKCWYCAGSDWAEINGGNYPKYRAYYIESSDGMSFGQAGVPCFDFAGDEYRISRPRVQKTRNKYEMYYTVGSLRGTYLAGYAESGDGRQWARKDDDVGISASVEGWDCNSLTYTAPIQHRNKEYLFYNGNDMGKTGFGYAERTINCEE